MMVALTYVAIPTQRLTQLKHENYLLDHKQRLLGFLAWLQTQSHEHALLVAHEESLRIFHAYHHGLNDQAMMKLHFDNCAPFSFEL